MKLLLMIAVGTGFLGWSAHAQAPHGPPSARKGTAASIPKLDTKKACKDTALGIEACLAQEDAARQMLIAKWATFPERDKSSCYNDMKTVDRTLSYINYVDCLLIHQSAREPLPAPKK